MTKIIFAVSLVTALLFLGSSFQVFADNATSNAIPSNIVLGNNAPNNNDNDTLAKLVLECQKQDKPDKICTLFNLIQTIQRTPGPPGPAGSPGSQILTGVGIPNSSLGSNNDFYLDTSTGNYYKKISGTWTAQGSLRGLTGSPGPQGDIGPQGPRGFNGTNGSQGPPGSQGLPGIVGPSGSQIFTDVGSPNLSLGSNNDFYLDTSTGNYYKKISGTWTAQGSLRGPPGSPGTQGPRGFNGTDGAQGLPGPPGPPGPRGFNGTNGSHGPQGDIGPQGPRGFNGTNGATGPQGDIGPQGPRGFNGTNGATGPQGDIGPQGPIGPRGFNGTNGATGPAGPQGPPGFNGTNGAQGLPGPRGFNGTNGAQGLPGSQIFTARGIPILSLGSNNDFYLDNSTGNYYKKISNSWAVQGNLVGPQGPPGTPANTTALQNQINSLNQQVNYLQLNSGIFNLLTYWKFDGGTLGLHDFTGSGNNLVVTGNQNYATGIYGNAQVFDGVTSDSVVNNDFPTGSADRTIAFWMNPASSAQSYYNIFCYGTSSPNQAFGMLLQLSTHKLLTFGWGNDFISTRILGFNDWTYVVVTLSNSGTLRSVYINGTLDSTLTSTSLNTPSSTFNVGYCPFNIATLNTIGKIDDMRIYNMSLNSTQVSYLYNMVTKMR